MAFSRSTLLSLAALALVFQTVSAGRALQQTGYATAWELLAARPELSTFYTAAQLDPGLVAGLKNSSSAVTLFAPTNAAFADLFTASNVTAAQFLATTPLATLARVLEYHVVPFNLPSTALTAGRTLQTLLGTSPTWVLSVEREGNQVMLQGAISDAFVVLADLYAGATVCHEIDSVLIPPSPTPPTATSG